MIEYFKLGVEGEGYTFFLPSSYRKDEKVLGSGIRRTISGKAKRDVITTKFTFELGFDYVGTVEYEKLYYQFENNIKKGETLKFIDDEGEYNVIWGGDNFGLNERQQAKNVYWSGTILLEEV